MKPGYKLTEVGVIPEDWGVHLLTNLSLISRLAGAEYTSLWEETPNGEITALRGFNIGQGRIIERDFVRISNKLSLKLKRSRLCRGDVVYPCVGSIGNAVVIEDDAKYHIQQNIARITPHSATIDSHYLSNFLMSSLAGREVERFTSSSSQPSVLVGSLRQYRIPLPPTVTEQRAIAEALGDVDALLGGLDRLIAKKHDLKQATMQQLLTGQTRLPGFHGEWEMKRLGDCLISRPDYGINAAAVPFSDMLPSYIRITDISEHGRFCPGPRVSVKSASADQYYLHEGDVVFARTGASVGKSYLYEPRDGELVFAGFLIRVCPNPELLVSAYLAAYATTKPYWNWVRLMSMRSGQPGINGNEYAQLPLSLPRLPEQTAIAEVLADMDAELVALEQRWEKTRTLKQAMMQELLTGRTRLVSSKEAHG